MIIFWLDYSRRRGWPRCGCERFQPGLGDGKPHPERRKEGKPSVYRIDAAAQTARCHDHHFGCWRGVTQVNVIPRKLEGSSDEDGALTVPPLDYGQSRGLDRELPSQLASFTESVTQTGSNLNELKTTRGAIKAVEAENRKKMDDKKKGNGARPASTPQLRRQQPRRSRTGNRSSGAKRPQQPG